MELVLTGFQVCLFVCLLYSYTGSNFVVSLVEKIYDFNSLQSDCFHQFDSFQITFSTILSHKLFMDSIYENKTILIEHF